MKKRIMAILMAVYMMLSCAPTVMAADEIAGAKAVQLLRSMGQHTMIFLRD